MKLQTIEKNVTAPSLTLHFAHANGFPAGSYRQLFQQLPQHWKVLAKPMFGHEPELPVGDNWQNQVQELINYVEQHRGGEKIYAVGHSFGAVISFMAACKRPDLFAGLVVIDPPLVLGAGSFLLRTAKQTAYINKITPARLAEYRNRQWSRDTDLVTYFQSKSLFRNMQPACIADYVESATQVSGEHRHLAFEPEIEAEIFRNVPHNLDSFKGQLQCPGLLITGAQSDVCKAKHWRRFVSSNSIAHKELPGGHMLPLEYPKELANELIHTLSQWAATSL